jgi:hypothetical protein
MLLILFISNLISISYKCIWERTKNKKKFGVGKYSTPAICSGIMRDVKESKEQK